MRVIPRPVTVLSALALLATGCGPGASDGCFKISNGYYLCDDGGDGRSIERRTGTMRFVGVVAPRVDRFRTEGRTIAIARQPLTVAHDSDGTTSWQAGGSCEYLLLDVETGAIRHADSGDQNISGLSCDRP